MRTVRNDEAPERGDASRLLTSSRTGKEAEPDGNTPTEKVKRERPRQKSRPIDYELHMAISGVGLIGWREKLALSILSADADPDTGKGASSSIELLATRYGATTRTVRKHVATLERVGFIVRVGQVGKVITWDFDIEAMKANRYEGWVEGDDG